ncbi:YopT-type cysteine protease domain-containing protein [Spartinivicinus sp. A2-2]|uniref:YopT-type cysteine protease domain-containing protein n=1 Tax=Spartinivicinus poritis TaxID=2994640 RepID=A0ABT5U5W4_9GAMM|nr:YopT-type cysteine protease domain-containing protein [Spartinivicinus sp. A2-2]MDE1461754.1 YopT-type cysteine protease domain-containing protein [Spartinivicinus sp. A2-2]
MVSKIIRSEHAQLPCYLLTISGSVGAHAMAFYENTEGLSIFFDPNERATVYGEKHDLSKAIAFELQKYDFLQPHTVSITNVEPL